MNYKKITLVTMVLCLAVFAGFALLFLVNPPEPRLQTPAVEEVDAVAPPEVVDPEASTEPTPPQKPAKEEANEETLPKEEPTLSETPPDAPEQENIPKAEADSKPKTPAQAQPSTKPPAPASKKVADTSKQNAEKYTAFSTSLLQPGNASEILLCDGSTKETVNVSQSKTKLAAAFSTLEITTKTQSGYDSLTGRRLSGASELRLKDESFTRYVYTFYEKGIVVTETNAGSSFYTCSATSLKPLYQLVTELFAGGKVTPSWLAIMSLGRYNSMQVYSSASGKRQHAGLIYDHSTGIFSALQGLHIQSDSLKKASTMPDSGVYYLEISFNTGVSYEINIEGTTLTIDSSDQQDALQYTLINDDAYKIFEIEVEHALA